MAAKVIASLITFIANIAIGVVILFTMLIAMNGYSEKDATWGLGVYILLALIVAILTSIGALLSVGFLIKKQFSPVVSALIAIAAFSIIGIIAEIVCSLIGVGVAEIVRVNY